jgi:hypothetical protein
MVVPRLTPTYLQVGDLQIKNVCRAGRCAQEKLVFPHVGVLSRLHADEAKSHDNYITRSANHDVHREEDSWKACLIEGKDRSNSA